MQRRLQYRLVRETVQGTIAEGEDTDVRMAPCQCWRGNDASRIDLTHPALAAQVQIVARIDSQAGRAGKGQPPLRLADHRRRCPC